jgi:hypothetical protein
MRPVRRDEIVDYQTYNDERDAFRSMIMAIKEPRRIHVGEYLTFLFETTETTRYQVQEMTRAEQTVKEADIQHELDTYNELLGGEGELGCSLLIEIDDEHVRNEKLVVWRNLPAHLYAKLEDGTLVRPTFDERQIGADRLSSVQYLKFDTEGRTPVALGADLPALTIEQPLNPAQRDALATDLAG